MYRVEDITQIPHPNAKPLKINHMSKFKDYRSLNGSNSRITKKHRSITPVVDVLCMVNSQSTGKIITNRKSEMREPSGRIIPRSLKPMSSLFDTPEEQFMYTEFCKAAGK